MTKTERKVLEEALTKVLKDTDEIKKDSGTEKLFENKRKEKK